MCTRKEGRLNRGFVVFILAKKSNGMRISVCYALKGPARSINRNKNKHVIIFFFRSACVLRCESLMLFGGDLNDSVKLQFEVDDGIDEFTDFYPLLCLSTAFFV
jgi:hypothetical protein